MSWIFTSVLTGSKNTQKFLNYLPALGFPMAGE